MYILLNCIRDYVWYLDDITASQHNDAAVELSSRIVSWASFEIVYVLSFRLSASLPASFRDERNTTVESTAKLPGLGEQ